MEQYTVIMSGEVEMRIAVADAIRVVVMMIDHRTKRMTIINLTPESAVLAARMLQEAARLLQVTDGHHVH